MQSTEKLPEDPKEAVKYLIDLGINLEGALIEEFKALEKQDGDAFQAAQEKKRRRFERFDSASREFRYNLGKYKGLDDSLIQQLEALQNKIKQQSQANMDVMKAYTDNAQAREVKLSSEQDIENKD